LTRTASANRAPKRWHAVANVELSDVRGDALLYREFTLALIWPRSCPEFLTDDEVSYWLNRCAATETLPWLIPDE
jgi:hypothetical protein